ISFIILETTLPWFLFLLRVRTRVKQTMKFHGKLAIKFEATDVVLGSPVKGKM
ncbi:hypothetical protein E2562_020722, partial [Oryza meyeriana var. granulata]